MESNRIIPALLDSLLDFLLLLNKVNQPLKIVFHNQESLQLYVSLITSTSSSYYPM